MKIFRRIFVLFCLFLLGFGAAVIVRRTDSALSGLQTLARISAPNVMAVHAQGDGRRLTALPSLGPFSQATPRMAPISFHFVGQNIALTSAAGAFNRAVVLDGSNYPWTDAGFSAALTAAGANRSVILPQGAIVTLTSAHVISTSGLTIDCAPGAGFVSGADGINLITIRGSSDEIVGCHFWAGIDPQSDPLFLWNSSSARIERNRVLGFAGISASFVYLVGAQSSVIQENQCVAASGGASCIFGEKNAIGTTVQSNNLDETLGAAGSHAITFHSTEPGETVSDTKVLSNQILAGAGFCVEVGSFGGGTPRGIVISENSCKMATDGLGGYSVGSAARFWTISNNTFDANGFKPAVSCIEVAGASDGTVTGNSCDGGNISLSNSQAQRVTISSNLIYDLRGECAGIYLGTSIEGGVVDDDLVIGNLIHLPSGAASIGIWQQCNAGGATCSNNSYSYNTIVSDGSSGSVGIKFENDYGVSQNETVGPNTFRSPGLSLDPVGLVSFKDTQTGQIYAPSVLPSSDPHAGPKPPMNRTTHTR